MYSLIETLAVAADTTAAPLAATKTSDRMLCFAVITNPTGTTQDVSLTLDAATAASGLVVPEGKRYLAGPFFGEDLVKHGLYAGATANVTVDVVRGRPFVDNGSQAGSQARDRVRYDSFPTFTFTEIGDA